MIDELVMKSLIRKFRAGHLQRLCRAAAMQEVLAEEGDSAGNHLLRAVYHDAGVVRCLQMDHSILGHAPNSCRCSGLLCVHSGHSSWFLPGVVELCRRRWNARLLD